MYMWYKYYNMQWLLQGFESSVFLTYHCPARWGRCQEGYGEDPYLQAELATQYVHGLQYGPDTKHIEAIVSCRTRVKPECRA